MLHHDTKTEAILRAGFAERFWRRVRKCDGCWTWTGERSSKGYGRIRARAGGGQWIRAHRASWVLANGQIPAGLQVLHRCDNPPCVRPEHLFLGTDATNRLDAAEKGRHFSIQPPSTGQIGEAQAAEIRVEIRAGRQRREIARTYGVSEGLIRAIAERRLWPHVA